MPLPGISSVHTNSAMSNVAIGYKNADYVLDSVFPVVNVQKESDYYYTWTQADMMRSEAARVAPGSRVPRGGFGLSSTTYQAEQWGFGWPVPRRIRDNADAAVKSEMNATGRVMDKILLAREIAIAAVLTGSSWSGAGSLAATGDWTADTGTPIADFDLQTVGIMNKIGKKANTAVMSYKVFRALRRHSDIIRFLGVGSASAGMPGGGRSGLADVTANVLSQILDIENIVVVNAIKNTAIEGATASYSPVLTDTVWVGYVTKAPAIDEPSAGYTFRVNQPAVRTYYEDAEDQDVYEARELYVPKATCLPAGALITACCS